MSKPDYILLLERNYPTAVFSGSCYTYDKIVWKDSTIPKPTKSTLDNEWATLEVILAMEKKIMSLSVFAGNEITTGFYSSALGSPYFYDANLEDQVNLIGVVADGSPSMFSVRVFPNDPQKTYMQHTSSQLKQVMDDGKLFKLTILQKFNALKNNVLSCTTIGEINAIVW